MKSKIKLFLSKLIATFFYSGLSKKAPGTIGSLAATICYLLIAPFFTLSQLAIITTIIFFVGWYVCSYLVKTLNNSDPQIIVIDEVVGIFITMTMVPIAYMQHPHNLIFAALCFAAFRLFDIAKPFPVSWADSKVKGGLGVMLDDVIAGFFAGFLVWAGSAIYKLAF